MNQGTVVRGQTSRRGYFVKQVTDAVVGMGTGSVIYQAGAGWWALMLIPFAMYMHFTGFKAGLRTGLSIGKKAFDSLNDAVEQLVKDIKAGLEDSPGKP